MTIESLQNILQVENELYHKEQLEVKKISAWVQEQQSDIQLQYEEKIAELKKRKRENQEQAIAVAEAKAAEILSLSKKKSEYLDTLGEDRLRASLHKSLPLIIGKKP